MALTHSTAPSHGRRVLTQCMSRLHRGHSTSPARFAVRPVCGLAHVQPHRVYKASVPDIIKGRLLTGATKASWRYLLVAGDEAVGAVELVEKSGRVKPGEPGVGFHAFREGPYVAGTLQALHEAEKLESVQQANFQIRFLRVPPLYFAALWLHRKGRDILIPIVSPPEGLVAYQPYSEAEVLKVLQPLALRVMEMHARVKQEQYQRRPSGKAPKSRRHHRE